MSAIVPWTEPGGTPCCCTEPIEPCTFNLQFLDVFPPIPWLEISSSQYAALYSAGTWSISAASNFNLSAGLTDAEDRPNVWDATSTGSGSISFSKPQGCWADFPLTGFGSGSATANLYPHGSWGHGINRFTPRILQHNGQFLMTIGGTYFVSTRAFGGTMRSFIDELAGDSSVTINGQVYPVNLSASASIAVSGEIIGNVAMRNNLINGGIGYNILRGSITGWDESGSSQYSFNFEPAAP